MLEFIALLEKTDFSIEYVDLSGEWAELNEASDLAHFILGTKAETLDRIRSNVKKSTILEQYTIGPKLWKEDPEAQISAVKEKFLGEKIIVRSSSKMEDNWGTSNAGAFKSMLDIDLQDHDQVAAAVDQVFSSYPEDDLYSEVLIQPFVKDVVLSGVIFTCDLKTGAPYYVINYDDKSGSTESVTAGNKGATRTLYISKTRTDVCNKLDPRISKVIMAASELEYILGYNKLDIEFCLDSEGNILTFQVRPITINHPYVLDTNEELSDYIGEAEDQFERWSQPAPQISGQYTFFSNMTDWNPAEIIGTAPDDLAKSLYSYLITDDVWARQRAEFGYRDIRPAPLVHYFCGRPYVDCRSSINSFIPRDLDEATTKRLVTAYLNMLAKDPHLHDKVELDVIFTIWEPNFFNSAKKRFSGSDVTELDIHQLETSLKKITIASINRLDSDLQSISKLGARFNLASRNVGSPIEKAYLLLTDCKEYGTLSFAHAARAGFVAIKILRGLVDSKFMSYERMLQFQNSIQTVAGRLQSELSDDRFSFSEVLSRYGHLRPGTYDINQLRYSENPDFYLRSARDYSTKCEGKQIFNFGTSETLGMKKYLQELGCSISIPTLVRYLRSAIYQREETKFVFSKNLSEAIDVIKEFGISELKLSRNETGFITVEDIFALRTGRISIRDMRRQVEARLSSYLKLRMIRLPDFVADASSFWGYEQSAAKGNYITNSSVSAHLVFLSEVNVSELENKIICIPNADPGYDWLFGHKIAGLITQYGGANSHMAIRCAEMSIPAAIGVGEKVYQGLNSGKIILDCRNEKITNA